jgi:cyclophilin family peptidyl-prolyl cis-trans isomerase
MIASIAAVGFSGVGGTNNPPAPIIDDGNTEEEERPQDQLRWPEGPADVIDPSQPHVAVLKTNQGEIKIKLLPGAPKAVNSFAFLAGVGFYDGTALFFVDKDNAGFAQGGDPSCRPEAETLCSGLGGPEYTLPVEPDGGKHEAWTVVAPAVVPGESVHGSQFRILFKPDPRLDGQETVFGVIEDEASRRILESLPDLLPCTMVDASGCAQNLESALVIEDVTVQPA